jgi:MoaA/NifB/PqqE/SkfB family radical SAM enzyme
MKKINGKLKDNIQAAKMALGIVRKRPFTGPWTVQIDINNSCNNNCIGCWCHSPLLGELAMDAETKKKFLPFDLLKRLIDNLDSLGVRDIYFTGGGEPFLHPNAVEIMEYVKKKNIRCDMSTNFTLIDEKKAEQLVKAGIDNMNCSVWAGSSEAYQKTHPNKTASTFDKIEYMLKYF